MKRILILITTLAAFSISSSAITVIDPTLIRTEMINAQRRLVEDLVRASNQATQIAKAIEQINLINEWLRRVGDLDEMDIGTIQEAQRLLEKVLSTKTGYEIERDAKLEELFIEHPVYGGAVTEDIYVDGKFVEKRELDSYKPELVARSSFAEFHRIREEAKTKRIQIEAQLKNALKRLERADTQAEVLKLEVTIQALSALLESTNAEVQVASDDALVRFAQNQNEARVAKRAREQEVRARGRRAVSRIAESYAPLTSPTYFTKHGLQ